MCDVCARGYVYVHVSQTPTSPKVSYGNPPDGTLRSKGRGLPGWFRTDPLDGTAEEEGSDPGKVSYFNETGQRVKDPRSLGPPTLYEVNYKVTKINLYSCTSLPLGPQNFILNTFRRGGLRGESRRNGVLEIKQTNFKQGLKKKSRYLLQKTEVNSPTGPFKLNLSLRFVNNSQFVI